MPSTISKTLIMAAATLFASYAFAAPPTPVSSCGTIINASGNYFLAQNLTCTGSTAVIVAASKGDLDLKGFTIDGGGGSGFGISTSSTQMSSAADLSLCLAVTNIHIHGGTIKGYGNPDKKAGLGPEFLGLIRFFRDCCRLLGLSPILVKLDEPLVGQL